MKLKRLYRTYKDWKKGNPFPQEYPLRVWIETTSRCNLTCPLCLNRKLDASDKGDMDFGLF